jgi:hypothetical protein
MLRLVSALVLFLSAAPAYAQSQAQVSVSGGRMFVGDDGGKTTLSTTVESVNAHGFSAGAEALVSFGRTGFRPRFPNGERYRQYLFSGLVGLHGLGRRGFAPFVNGGVSLITDPDCCGPYGLLNVGGGTNYWISDRLGVRTGVRLGVSFGGVPVLALGRVGMVFR